MTYLSDIPLRLRAGIQNVLGSTPQEDTDHETIKDWLATGADTSSVVWLVRGRESRSMVRPPSRTAPPVIIGWVAQVILNEDFNSTSFENGELGPQGEEIIKSLGSPAMIEAPKYQSGADVIIGVERKPGVYHGGTISVFESDLYEMIDPGAAISRIQPGLQVPVPGFAEGHNPYVVAWAFQSLLVEDPYEVTVASALPPFPERYVRNLGNALLSDIDPVGPPGS